MKRSASLKEDVFEIESALLDIRSANGCSDHIYLHKNIVSISTDWYLHINAVFPILIALFLYFIFNPVLVFLEEKKYLEI